MSMKRTIVGLLIILLMTSTAFAGNVYPTKNTDQKEIEEITNSFFTEKEQTFLSNSHFNIAKYSNPVDAEKIKRRVVLNFLSMKKRYETITFQIFQMKSWNTLLTPLRLQGIRL